MKQFKPSTIEKLKLANVTAETPDDELRKAFFKANSGPIKKDDVAALREALNGNPEALLPAEAPKAAKEPKAPKEPKPVKAAETPEAALSRLKASSDPKIAERWARVRRVDQMGKKGPTVVTIVCDNRAEDGSEILRTIKVQDLFQVRYSADYSKKAARVARAAAKKAATPAPAAEATAQ